MNGHDDFDETEQRLRDSLRRRAAQAPTGDEVADRVLAAVGATGEGAAEVVPLRSRRGWRTWTTPLLAAAAVAAVVATVVGVGNLHDEAGPVGPGTHTFTRTYSGGQHSTSPVSTPSSTQPVPSSTTVVAPPASSDAPSSTSTGGRRKRTNTSPPAGQNQGTGTSAPAQQNDPGSIGASDFRALSTSFVADGSALDGWAIGPADCLRANDAKLHAHCTALVRTFDGGDTWAASTIGGTVPDVPASNSSSNCPSARCVDTIRFANKDDGYLFGPTSFLTTTNGTDWTQQAGGAVALETLDDNVIRVTPLDGSCTGECRYVVQTAAIGSDVWTDSGLSGFDADSVHLVRTHRASYLLVQRPAGADGVPDSTLYRSSDLGADWSAVNTGCPGASGAADVSAGGVDGSLQVLCRDATGRYTLRDSGDARVVRLPGRLAHKVRAVAAIDAETVLLVADDGLYRSADGGDHWRHVVVTSGADATGPPGFQDSSRGTWVVDAGRTILRTSDAGRSWTPFRFSS